MNGQQLLGAELSFLWIGSGDTQTLGVGAPLKLHSQISDALIGGEEMKNCRFKADVNPFSL